MNTEQGEQAMNRADDRDDVSHGEPCLCEGCEAWRDMPGVPPPTPEELEEMARYFNESK